MKRPLLAVFLALAGLAAVSAQTTIDKPAATIKLIRSEVISVRQFKSGVEKLEAAMGQKLTPEQRRQFLDKLIDEALFVQYCEREKIVVSDSEVNAALAQMKAGAGAGMDDAKFELALRSQGVVTDPKTYVRQQLLIQAYLKTRKADELKSVKDPTADEILQAYDLYKSQLVRPDTIRVSVIYVDLRNLSADDKKKAADALRQVYNQLKASPARFDEFVLKASDQGSLVKANGNFYVEKTPQGQATYGQTFFDTVFKLKAGEVSGLIENEAGLQVVRVNEILPQKSLALSDPLPGNPKATVQDYLKYLIGTKRQNEVLTKIQDDLHDLLRKEGSVKVYDENLNF